MPETKKIQENEQGFASIVVALILIIVLALLTIGFAQLARREQQNALDKQLSNQAYYAAESGVNDVVDGIKKGLVTEASLPMTSSKKCLTGGQLTSLSLNRNIDTSHGVAYTCVMVDLTPPNLEFNIAPGNSQSSVFTPSPAPATPTIALTIQWGSGDATPALPHDSFFPPGQTPSFTPTNAWNAAPGHPPVLQFSITPFSSTSFDRNALINKTFTIYTYPSKNSPGPNNPACPAAPNSTTCVAYDLAQQAQIVKGRCSTTFTPAPCSVTIYGIPYVAGSSDMYLLHFMDFYDDASVYFNGVDQTGASFSFSGAQDTIDVTGQARNVLKRIQVRVPANQSSSQAALSLPSAALQAGNICKHFQVDPTNGANFLNADGSLAGPGTACNLE
ncbi:MAG TPA: PilX N-terminal domain-containing pilus assembly protein [Verrucomicrobiae bacterium]|nr:PilX N-terminal domain-containing pilus assembly protein [Verrucomicrobiae bacterium]